MTRDERDALIAQSLLCRTFPFLARAKAESQQRVEAALRDLDALTHPQLLRDLDKAGLARKVRTVVADLIGVPVAVVVEEDAAEQEDVPFTFAEQMQAVHDAHRPKYPSNAELYKQLRELDASLLKDLQEAALSSQSEDEDADEGARDGTPEQVAAPIEVADFEEDEGYVYGTHEGADQLLDALNASFKSG